MVNNDKRIAEPIKLRCLLNSVQGLAKAALKGVPLSTSRFQVAWDKLLRRYDVSKHKLYNYLEGFVNISTVTHASASALGLFIDKSEKLVKGLSDLQCFVEHFDV